MPKNIFVPLVSKEKAKEPHTHPNRFQIQSSGFICFIWIYVVQCVLQALMQNGVIERRNRTLVEAARTMWIFSHAPLFLWAEAIATVCYTQNRSIIHRRFNKTPYKLIQGRKPDISYLNVFGALCYTKIDREDIGKLCAKGDIGFFIGYSANFVAYRVYNRGKNKIMETINITFDVLSAMAFEQNSSRPGLQSLTSGQISSELELIYAPGRPSKASRITPAAPVIQNLQAPTASMSFQDSAPVPTKSSNTLISSQNVDETSQQHAQQQRNLTPSPTASAADNVPNDMFEGDLFVNPFGTPSIEFVVSSTQYESSQNILEVIPDRTEVLYKMLYALEMCKSISVAEKMGHPSLSHSFRRMPRGGVEQENYDLLCLKVTDLVLPNISDRWRCDCLRVWVIHLISQRKANRENGRMILNLVLNGLLVWPTIIEDNGTTRTKKYEELSVLEKLQADCDIKATNIVLQGLTPDVYAIVNHHKVTKEIWNRVKLLMQGTKLSL
nr:retrovirus-related Pol polyprotein from transposon TNT 1-94 [Tanacetum cinerariifolium]